MTGKELKPSRVLVQLDREREIRFDLNALVELESYFGGLDKIMTAEMNLATLRFLIWAGLLHESPDLKERDVGRMIPLDRLQELAEKVTRALTNAIPLPNPTTPQEMKAARQS